MYAPSVVEDRLKRILASPIGAAYPDGVERLPVAHCQLQARLLNALLDPKKGLTRQLSSDEIHFVRNERLLTKVDYRYWAERYCNPPEAPIWMGDLAFKPLGDIRIGDQIIGWEKQFHGTKRKVTSRRTAYARDTLVRTRVVATQRRRSPLVRVIFESGRELRCTPDHWWSNGNGGGRLYDKFRKKDGTVSRYSRKPWVHAEVGKTLSFVVDPFDAPPSGTEFLRGWLAGMYDGEGSHYRISQYAVANPLVHAQLHAALATLGIEHTMDDKGAYLTGGRRGWLRFLQWCPPHKQQYLQQHILGANFRQADKVVAVIPDAAGEVVSLQTETGNYVAWGYASKNCQIIRPDRGISPMYPLWESQELILASLAEEEEKRYAAKHPDGLVANILKGRQLGCSTLAQSMVAHRVTTQSYTKGMVASDVPENSGSTGLFGMLELTVEHLPWFLVPAEKFHTKSQHIVFNNFSSVVVEAGKSMKGGLQDEGGQKGQLGRSKTYSCVHLSELSTWEYPETIDDSLDPAIARTPRTLWLKESTAKGRHNWWHQEWLATERGYGRSFNIFIPWYAERSKYWLPVPDGWEPPDYCLEYAERVNRHAPRWMRRPFTLSKEQLYWYFSQYEAAQEKGILYKFFEEYPAEPEESFQYSGRSIFSPEQIDRLRNCARPLKVLYQIAPASLITEFRDAAYTEKQVEKEIEASRKGPVVVVKRTGDPANAPEPVEEPVS